MLHMWSEWHHMLVWACKFTHVTFLKVIKCQNEVFNVNVYFDICVHTWENPHILTPQTCSHTHILTPQTCTYTHILTPQTCTHAHTHTQNTTFKSVMWCCCLSNNNVSHGSWNLNFCPLQSSFGSFQKTDIFTQNGFYFTHCPEQTPI